MGNIFSENPPPNSKSSVRAVPVGSGLNSKESDAVRHLYESWRSEGQGAVTLSVLKVHIPVAHLPDSLLAETSTADSFIIAVGSLCKPATPRVLLETLYNFAQSRSQAIDEPLLRVLFEMVHDISLWGIEPPVPSATGDSIAKKMAQFALLRAQFSAKAGSNSTDGGEAPSFDLTAFVLYSNDWLPGLSKAVVSFAIYLFLPFDNKSNGSTFVPFFAPTLLDGGYAIVKPQDLVPLALYCTLMQGRLRRLYSSNLDGNSFSAISQSVVGWAGPTLILVRPRLPKAATDKQREAGVIFGAVATERWHEDRKYFGSSSSFLFTLSPELRLLPVRGSDTNYQWLNTRGHNPKTHGLAMGGSSDFRNPRLFLPSSLDECFVGSNCSTFQPGALAPSWALRSTGTGGGGGGGVSVSDTADSVNIDCLEIWAIGGDKAISNAQAARGVTRELNEDTLQKARRVDRAAFFGSKFDREMFLGKTFAHQSESDGRES